ncbi:NADH dehydrogenase [Rhodotorula toruloides]|uniref:NADH dehydrogenase n=1 Tax=Rhodotorula toruloides TaxID=5286 RepID=A0A511KID2_RHOTO|nr:NADH dehydrogenase [Rhodotorula toruloides]
MLGTTATVARAARPSARTAATAALRTPKFKLTSPASSIRLFSSSSRWDKQKLVILGSGWGGYELLRKVDKKRYDVTVISPNSYFAFTPLLASASVGTIDYNSALEPTYYQAWADKVDFDRKQLVCMPATGSSTRKRINASISDATDSSVRPTASFPGYKPFELSYDKLVVAVGCYSATFGIPGVSANGYFLKDIRDSSKIRSRILECFELASVEFAGELHDLTTTELAEAYPKLSQLVRITIYDVAPGILGSFDKSLAEYATAKFVREGIQIKGSRHVTAVHEGVLDIKEEGKVPFGLLVWNTGLAPNPLIQSIKELQKDEKTKSLKINDTFNPVTDEGKELKDVFVIGDASALQEKLPATAQVASQEAHWLSKILNAEARGQEPPGGFTFHNRGTMAYLGDWSAILDRSKVKDGPKGELTGRTAWLAWRSAYWLQALSFRNRVSLAYHWFATWLGGRRLSRF